METSLKWKYIELILVRPILAISFVISLISLGWFVAWKVVLVHVPLVQEIFGLRKKTFKPKPDSRGRFSKLYNSFDNSHRQNWWFGIFVSGEKNHEDWRLFIGPFDFMQVGLSFSSYFLLYFIAIILVLARFYVILDLMVALLSSFAETLG